MTKTPKTPPFFFPNWSEMLTLWLSARCDAKPAVVFCSPLANQVTIRKHFKKLRNVDEGMMLNGEYAVLSVKTVEEGLKICHATPSEAFTMVWDGKKIVSQNG